MNPLPQQLRNRREQLHLKQWEVAERANMPMKRYQEYESGNRGMTLTTLTKITRALGVQLTITESEER